MKMVALKCCCSFSLAKLIANCSRGRGRGRGRGRVRVRVRVRVRSAKAPPGKG